MYGPKWGVIGERMGEQVRSGIALQAQRPPAVLSLAHQAGRAAGVGLDRQAGQQTTIAIERHLRQPLGVLGVVPVELGVLALEAVRTHDPKKAVSHDHAFQIGLLLRQAGQVEQIGQREVAHLAEAQGLAPHRREPAQSVQAAGFVASHPEPIAGEGRAREVGLNQGAGSELQA
jgi:hypothetical protein